MRQALALPPAWLIVDLAAGRGRHAVPLAAAGRRVVAVDIAEQAISAARRAAGGALDGVVADVAALPFREGAADAILCVNFLDRSLFPHLRRLLRTGGRLVVETYSIQQLTLERGPRNTVFLLQPGELPTLVAPMRVLESREGLIRDAAGERYVASVLAVNAAPGE